jgi:hypothetical protein
MTIRAIGLLAAILAVSTAIAGAQATDPAASGTPVQVSSPFVIPWHHDTELACMTFTNTSDRPIKAVRFGLTTTQEDPLGSTPESDFIDRIGTFAPGVAIRPPTKFLGTVNSQSAALANCWETPASNIKSELHIAVLKVVYSDDTVWVNPAPEPVASVTY